MAKYPAGLLAPVAAIAGALVRVTAWSQPLVNLLNGNPELALFAAQAFGVGEGFMRWVGFQNAHSVVVENGAITVHSGLSQTRIPWVDVLAVETWRRVSRCDFVAIHYRAGGALRIVSCFEQDGREALQTFLTACGSCMKTESQRLSMTVAGLEERGVWLPLLRRFAIDVAVPTSVAGVFGLFREGFPLALLSASLSASLSACGFSLRTARYVSNDGLWYRETRRGQQRLRSIPPRLWAWTNLLAEDAWQRERRAAR